MLRVYLNITQQKRQLTVYDMAWNVISTAWHTIDYIGNNKMARFQQFSEILGQK